MKENTHYNKIIKKQYKDYLKYKQLIDHLTDKLLTECNTLFIYGNSKETEEKLQSKGKHLVYIGSGGFIHKAKLDKYYKGIDIINIHIKRNLRINFYGALYYELGNYEYNLGGTSLHEILKNMGVELEETPTDYNIKYPSNINPQLFNYTVAFYKSENEHY